MYPTGWGPVIFPSDVEHTQKQRPEQRSEDPVRAADSDHDEKGHQEFHRKRRIDAADDIGGQRSAQSGKPAADREGDGEDAVDIDARAPERRARRRPPP